jgi:hypothetical protein
MSSTKQLQRQTVKRLVTEGMGYCCLWAFFRLYKRTAQIALRLGVEDRTVRYHKSAFNAGCYRCEQNEKCLKGRRLA